MENVIDKMTKLLSHLRKDHWKECATDEIALGVLENLVRRNRLESNNALLVVGVGKYAKEDIRDVPTGYLRWLLTTDKKLTSPPEDDIIAKHLIEERNEDYRYLGDAGMRYKRGTNGRRTKPRTANN